MKSAGEPHSMVGRVIFIVGLLLIVYLGMAYSAHQIRESSLKGCQRRNAGQLAALRSTQALRVTALQEKTLALARHDVTAAKIASDEVMQQESIAAELKNNAEATGYATAIGAVTIECSAAYPDALPWPGG